MICRRPGAKRPLKARALIAFVAVASFAGAASAQSANPFAFLFGGSPREGRSAFAPAPAYVPAPSYRYGSRSSGYSTLPGYSDPYGSDRDRDYRPEARPADLEGVHHGQSPKEVMAAIKAVKPGKGPLGRFLNDPTLRAGDVVVTTKGLMVYRGGGGASHRESDFVSISNASGLVANKQSLISLETASRLTPRKPLGAETKPPRKPAPEIASSATPKPSAER
jgi:hypothetical protein